VVDLVRRVVWEGVAMWDVVDGGVACGGEICQRGERTVLGVEPERGGDDDGVEVFAIQAARDSRRWREPGIRRPRLSSAKRGW